MAIEIVPQTEPRNPNIDEVMARRLLARMREMWPDEAALAARPKLTLIQGGKEGLSWTK